MKFGDRGIDVIKAQDFLIEEGFLDKRESYYSIKTMNAVKNMQNYLGIEENGEFTEHLKKLYNFKVISEGRSFVNYVTGSRVTNGPNTSNPSTGATIPEATTPGATIPGATIPGATTPGATTPGATIPEIIDVGESENPTEQADFDESLVEQKQEIPCYLVNLITNNNGSGVVYFPHIPEEFSYSKSNNFEEMEIKGRSEPFQGYNNSSALTVDISVTISADYCENHDIDSVLQVLESFAYPRYSEAGRIVPPKCFFRCATFSVEGVLESINIVRKLPIIDGKYTIAEVSISIIETHPTSVSAKTVEGRSSRT